MSVGAQGEWVGKATAYKFDTCTLIGFHSTMHLVDPIKVHVSHTCVCAHACVCVCETNQYECAAVLIMDTTSHFFRETFRKLDVSQKNPENCQPDYHTTTPETVC